MVKFSSYCTKNALKYTKYVGGIFGLPEKNFPRQSESAHRKNHIPDKKDILKYTKFIGVLLF